MSLGLCQPFVTAQPLCSHAAELAQGLFVASQPAPSVIRGNYLGIKFVQVQPLPPFTSISVWLVSFFAYFYSFVTC